MEISWLQPSCGRIRGSSFTKNKTGLTVSYTIVKATGESQQVISFSKLLLDELRLLPHDQMQVGLDGTAIYLRRVTGNGFCLSPVYLADKKTLQSAKIRLRSVFTKTKKTYQREEITINTDGCIVISLPQNNLKENQA